MVTKKGEKPVLFSTMFPEDLKMWCINQKAQRKPGTQYDFAKQVGVPPYYVTDWKTGRSGIPYKHLSKICEVLGVSEDRYYLKTHTEHYENSKRYITEVGKKNADLAKEKGLDLDLVRALSQVVDFDESFPVYAPFNRIKGSTVCRSVNNDSAPIDSSLDYLQVEQDGKRKTFHVADLAFLKEVQDQVVDYVNYLFYRRKQEMKREEAQFNEDLAKADFTGPFIPEQFILDHDRFAYLFTDVKVPNPNYDIENSTQKAIGWLFESGRGQEISNEDLEQLVSCKGGETITFDGRTVHVLSIEDFKKKMKGETDTIKKEGE